VSARVGDEKLTVEQEVGGSSPPNCTKQRIEIVIFSWMHRCDLSRRPSKGSTKVPKVPRVILDHLQFALLGIGEQ
jgi:hypothetical protein